MREYVATDEIVSLREEIGLPIEFIDTTVVEVGRQALRTYGDQLLETREQNLPTLRSLLYAVSTQASENFPKTNCPIVQTATFVLSEALDILTNAETYYGKANSVFVRTVDFSLGISQPTEFLLLGSMAKEFGVTDLARSQTEDFVVQQGIESRTERTELYLERLRLANRASELFDPSKSVEDLLVSYRRMIVETNAIPPFVIPEFYTEGAHFANKMYSKFLRHFQKI